MPSAKNPRWSEEELILALDHYVRVKGQFGHEHTEDIIELSKHLNRLKIHPKATRQSNFRSPIGVWGKLGNFAYLDPNAQRYPNSTIGNGLTKAVWDRYASKFKALRTAAAKIVQRAKQGSSPQAEGETVIDEAVNPQKRPGFSTDAEHRKCVELHAMALAEEYLVRERFGTIRNVSANQPFDFAAIKDGQEHAIEVKGTTGDGTGILLTKNEVKLHAYRHPHNMLVLVHSIQVEGDIGKLKAKGGVVVCHPRWRIVASRLKPLAYTYTLAHAGSPRG
jgi:hypothetical protein